jgi:hypothetical protein
MICGYTLKPANSDWLFFNPSPPARRFTGTVAGTAQNAWKNIGFPVDHIGLCIFSC